MKENEMVRIRHLANELSTTDHRVIKLCERFGIPIIRAGRRKIRMVSKELFLEKMEQEGRR